MIWKPLIAIAVIALVSLAVAARFERQALIETTGGHPQYQAIDRCLDSGGCWDYQKNVCREGEPDAQRLCDGANPFMAKSVQVAQEESGVCKCLAEKQDLWLCGMAQEPLASDLPNRENILRLLVQGAQIGQGCIDPQIAGQSVENAQ